MKMKRSCEQGGVMCASVLIIMLVGVGSAMLVASGGNTVAPLAQPPGVISFYNHITRKLQVNLAMNTSTESSAVSGLLEAYNYRMTRNLDDDDDDDDVAIASGRGLALLVGLGDWEAVAEEGEVIFAIIDYDDGIFKGSVSLQGHFLDGDPDAEVAVVGGTKDFRRVQGYGFPTVISQSSNKTIIHWELHLFYPSNVQSC